MIRTARYAWSLCAAMALVGCGAPDAHRDNPDSGGVGGFGGNGGSGGEPGTSQGGAPAPPPRPVLEVDGLAWGAGRFVAVGRTGMQPEGDPGDGVIYTSLEGLRWELVRHGLGVPLRDVRFGNGRFVTMGSRDGVTREYVSDDGVEWNETPLPPRAKIASSFAFGNGVFVAATVGNASAYVSSDGITWNALPSGYTIRGDQDFGRGVVYGAHTFALWEFGAGAIALSSDGQTWALAIAPGGGFGLEGLFGREDALAGHAVYRCCYGEVPPIYEEVESADGTTWVTVSGRDNVLRTPTSCVTFGGLQGNGYSVAVGCDTPTEIDGLWGGYAVLQSQGVTLIGGTNGIVASLDGTTWQMALYAEPR